MRPIDFRGCPRCNSITLSWVCEICGNPIGRDWVQKHPARAYLEPVLDYDEPEDEGTATTDEPEAAA